MEKVNFSIEDGKIINDNPDSNFAVLSLDFFASGINKHDLYISEETLMRTADTIKNCPLVWKYDKYRDDAYTHDKDEVPCGFVPDSSGITSKKLDDGRTMLSVIAYVWKRYTGELLRIFKRDGGKKDVSVEMSVLDSKQGDDGHCELLDFKYEGITVLGRSINPAVELASATVLSFAELKNEYNNALKEEFSTETSGSKKGSKDNAKKDVTGEIQETYLDDKDLGKEEISMNKDEKEIKNVVDDEVTKPVKVELAKEDEKVEAAKVTEVKISTNSEEEKDEKEKAELAETEKAKAEKAKSEKEKAELAETEKAKAEKEKPVKAELAEENEELDVEPAKPEKIEQEVLEQTQMSVAVGKILKTFKLVAPSYRKMKTEYGDSVVAALEDFANGISDGSFDFATNLNKFIRVFVKSSGAEIVTISDNYKQALEEIVTLKEYKTKSERKRLDFEIDSVLSDAFEAGMSKDDIATFREESVEFTLDTIDAFKNMVKAKAFVFVSSTERKGNKEEFVKIGLPFNEEKPKQEQIWK